MTCCRSAVQIAQVVTGNQMTMATNRSKTEQADQQSGPPRESSKSKSDAESSAGIQPEVPGVHVINSKDIEGHFGSESAEAVPLGRGQAASSKISESDAVKTEVRLLLDKRIMRRAEAAASQNGIDLSLFVEQALVRFMNEARD